jgi:transposase
VQVVIALIVTPDGFPLAYEVMDGNTSDKTTLKAFLAKIAAQYGAAKRTWVMLCAVSSYVDFGRFGRRRSRSGPILLHILTFP